MLDPTFEKSQILIHVYLERERENTFLFGIHVRVYGIVNSCGLVPRLPPKVFL